MRNRRRFAALVALALGLVPLMVTNAAARPSGYTTVPTPPVTLSGLQSVSCTSARFCLAVGSGVFQTSNGPLVMSWDGTAWTVVPLPLGSPQTVPNALRDVSCVSPTYCKIVGHFEGGRVVNAGAMTFDGSRLTVDIGIPVPVVPAPGHPTDFPLSSLEGISCLSSTNCYAVGSVAQPQSPPGPSGAVPWTEHWNGTAWSAMVTPLPPGDPGPRTYFSTLSKVSCPSNSFCEAVGYSPSGLLVDHWNGWQWSAQPSPLGPSSATQLFGVSCVHRLACQAVGITTNPDRTISTLALGWNGFGWRVEPTPDTPGEANSLLFGVSCVSARNCDAVGATGRSVTASGSPAGVPSYTMAEHWDGRSWTRVPTWNTDPGDADGLTGVSCFPQGCFAVNTIQVRSPATGQITTLQPLIERR